MTTYPELDGDWRTVAAQLWSEWCGELSAFFRAKFAGRWTDDRKYIRLDIGADEIGLDRVAAHDVQVLAHATIAGEDNVGSLAAIMPEARAVLDRSRGIVIRFSRQSVLRLQLEMPAASRAILRKAVAFELEQLSPIGPDRLYFDFCTTKMRSMVRVELRAIKRTVVDQAIALCHASNLGVSGICFEDDAREAEWRAFPVDRPAFLRRQWARKAVAILGVTGLLLFVAVLFAFAFRGAEQANLLQAQLDDATNQTSVVHRLQQNIRDLRTQIEFPAAQKRAPLLVDVLLQLTKALPDGTWLTEFGIKDGQVHVRGYSKSASDLVGDIDQSPYFANAEFSAPLEGAQNGTERFDLTFDVKAAVQP